MKYIIILLLLIGCKNRYAQRPPILFKNGDTALSFVDSSIFIHQGVGSHGWDDSLGWYITAWNNTHTDTVYFFQPKISCK